MSSWVKSHMSLISLISISLMSGAPTCLNAHLTEQAYIIALWINHIKKSWNLMEVGVLVGEQWVGRGTERSVLFFSHSLMRLLLILHLLRYVCAHNALMHFVQWKGENASRNLLLMNICLGGIRPLFKESNHVRGFFSEKDRVEFIAMQICGNIL